MRELTRNIFNLISNYKSLSDKIIKMYFSRYPYKKIEEAFDKLISDNLITKFIYTHDLPVYYPYQVDLKKLDKVLEDKGMSLYDLSELSGIPENRLRLIRLARENEKTLNKKTVDALSEALGLKNSRQILQGYKSTVLYQSADFNPGHEVTVFDNDYITVERCLEVLIELQKSFDISFHKLCYYPSTIRFSVDSDDGEHLFEIVYVPYSDNNAIAKHLGSFIDREYDERFGVNRIAVCEHKRQFKDKKCRDEILEYIPNICTFARVTANDTVLIRSVDDDAEDF